ncbi:MAG TPA: sulfatase-like hydrolase/transferase [Chitinophagaceae bacterium]|nr:sulfatase-like hydrolase/transferase [Chitinophagaceae bacterium]
MLFKAGCIALLCCITGVGSGQVRPDIIYIMADDLGWADLSCYGNKEVHTPNLDRLARGGMKFTSAYAAAPVCTPTRAAFMTGRYPARIAVGLREPLDQVREDSLVGLTHDQPSLPSLLKKSGYTTQLVGKWHLGFLPQYGPLANGFDGFYGYLGGAIDYVSHTDPFGNIDLYNNYRIENRKGYMTDILADQAISFINRKQEKPFFLSLQFSAPHWPWQAPGDTVYPKGYKAWKEGGSKQVYTKMVERMDSLIGKIIDAVEKQGRAKNTVIIFTSDNGGEQYSNMGGLKQKKMVLWEGGVRVPAILYWPGKISPGTVTDQPVITMDWTATILALAGAQPDPAFPLDGMDIMPIIKDGAGQKERTFYWRVFQRQQQKAIRQGEWKYLGTADGEFLFNIEADPFETNDLKQIHPAKFEELKRKYSAWETTMLKPVPLPR